MPKRRQFKFRTYDTSTSELMRTLAMVKIIKPLLYSRLGEDHTNEENTVLDVRKIKQVDRKVQYTPAV